MDTCKSVRFYVDRMLTTGDNNGMKVLLFDEETLKIMGLVYSRHLILERGVFLHDYLSAKNRKKMTFLLGIVFVRPTQENLQLLKEELRDPKYKKYRIYFSNAISDDQLQELASADQHEVVESVQEFYGDFYAIDPHLFTLNISNSLHLSFSKDVASHAHKFDRAVKGTVAAFLAMKMVPVMRYTNGLPSTKVFADAVSKCVTFESKKKDNIFHTRPSALLLVLDRKDDPVTPLLTQWHYQAMVHELIGIDLNRVDLSSAPDVKLEEKEVVLAQTEDKFFGKHMFSNFGTVGAAVKELMQNFQNQHQSTQNLKGGATTVEDIQAIVDNFPELKKNSNDVAKHVTLMSELARLVDAQSLMKLSALEQDIACSEAHTKHAERVEESLKSSDPELRFVLLRMVLLYTLRYYQRSNKIAHFTDLLRNLGLEDRWLDLVEKIQRYDAAVRTRRNYFPDGDDFFNKLGSQITRELNGVENVYTQHNPLLKTTLENLLKGKMKKSDFPYLAGEKVTTKNIVVYMIGGFTYEEAMATNELSKTYGVSIVLGGDRVHNSRSFLSELASVDIQD